MSLFRKLLSSTPYAKPVERNPSSFPPDVRYFALFGELTENYGGTANVMLHRSNLISKATHTDVELLVLGHQRDYDKINEELQGNGKLLPSVRFRSMWKDLASLPEDSSIYDCDKGGLASYSPLTDTSTTEIMAAEGVKIRRFRRNPEGKNLQIDLCRADGTVIVSDRRDVRTPDGSLTRSVILCDSRGLPRRSFTSLIELQQAWIDAVIGSGQAVLFTDTFGMTEFARHYRRPNVAVIKSFHNNHLGAGATSAFAPTQERYLSFLSNIDAFDATVVLTKRQNKDLERLLGRGSRRWVVPNSRELPETPIELDRPNSRGIYLGRLVTGKQIDHALNAVDEASRACQKRLSLDIYGDGPEGPRLQEDALKLLHSTVNFHGHDPHAAEHFASSSFSILTSESEGLPLVIIESMARGCIPLAYDVRYGPGDLITHGVNGFLVPPNNIDALVKTIAKLQTMSPRKMLKMRKAAIETAQMYTDDAVAHQWARVVSDTLANKRSPVPLHVQEHVATHSVEKSSLNISGQFTTDRALDKPRVHLIWRGRKDPVITRINCNVNKLNAEAYQFAVRMPSTHVDWHSSDFWDATLEISDETGRATSRLSTSGSRMPFGAFHAYATVHGNLSLKPQQS